VDRRHQKHALARELEDAHLDNHAHSLDDEDAAEEHREKFVLGQDSERSESATEGERADIPHEHLRRIGVIPKKAEANADDRGAENGELARALDARDVKVFGEAMAEE